jgi:hypothetical protein
MSKEVREVSRGVALLGALSLLSMGVGMADPLAAPTPTAALQPSIDGSPFPGEIGRFSGLAVQLLVTTCHTKDSYGHNIVCAGEVLRHTTVWLGETPASYHIAFMFAPEPKNILCEAPQFSISKQLDKPLPVPTGGFRPISLHAVITDGKAVQILDEACAKIVAAGNVGCEGDWLKANTAVVLDGERYYSVYFYPSGLKATIDKPLRDPAERAPNCG